ncbi:heme-binding protein [bacterium]|nr:heme-binding protein [bacterium]
MALETPKYKVVISERDFELREYQPMVVAQVLVTGEREQAARAGFRLVADYIFGNNTTSQKIQMTAPVSQSAQTQSSEIAGAGSQKISMTAPVMQQKQSNEEKKSAEEAQWTLAFFMPSEYSMATLPKPNNAKVTLMEMAASKRAVIQFSGSWSVENFDRREQELLQWIKSKNLTHEGAAIYARFNAPWSLPFLRRNEVQFIVKD